MMPGENPASAAPSRKRRTASWTGVWTNAIRTVMIPQLTMIRVSQTRAPVRTRNWLLGTSKMT